ncbi:NAD-dependent epimerase/dehydratase family protein [Thermosipho ferrireducens]|uniref:NAD-dependent epimerase/dehydratase family protein n=1 Tax=Thermosipho ferrireducens TaxID=2571116 RepID=A0ABX7S7S7_9BACT|nr:NAD-dependent epimerase/dehydratase family protein [Thermosipho ferrireducens]QTA38644.1 NAD-dependent epimerase/dehydratase family protein [Thermosipho ferrireducens]
MIFITGGSGHLGNVLIRKLRALGEKIVTLVHPNDKCTSLEELDVKILKCDIRNCDKLDSIIKESDVVIHLAAIISILPWRKKLVYSINVNGTKNILKLVQKHNKKLIYVSSVHAFSEPEPYSIIDESTTIDPKLTSGVYGKSKATAALEVMNAAKSGVDVVTICPTGIIGPFDFKPSNMGIFFLNYLKGKLKYIIDGSFDFVDVRDVATGIISSIEKGKKGQFYILGNKTISLLELIKTLNKISGLTTIPEIVSTKIAYFFSYLAIFYGLLTNSKPLFTPYSIHTLTRNYIFSHSKAQKELSYNPRPFELTLSDTLKWFKEYFITKKYTLLHINS